MTNPKDVLNPDDYSNYRNIRAVSILFVIFGSVLALGGIGLAADEDKRLQERLPLAVAVGLAIAGLAGAVGGIAALRGSRRWSPLVYVMATVYIFGFPIGTILSFVTFKGLSRYLDCVERIRAEVDA